MQRCREGSALNYGGLYIGQTKPCSAGCRVGVFRRNSHTGTAEYEAAAQRRTMACRCRTQHELQCLQKSHCSMTEATLSDEIPTEGLPTISDGDLIRTQPARSIFSAQHSQVTMQYLHTRYGVKRLTIPSSILHGSPLTIALNRQLE